MDEEDWSRAEALAIAYVKAEKNARDPISVRRHAATPFLFALWWPEGDENAGAFALVYDGKIQPATGLAALPPYFAFLGEDRLRALTVSDIAQMDRFFDAFFPKGPGINGPYHGEPDLEPTIVEKRGVRKYVVHYTFGGFVPETPQGEPPAPYIPVSGSLPSNWPITYTRCSLQLVPVLRELEWQREGEIKRARRVPPITP